MGWRPRAEGRSVSESDVESVSETCEGDWAAESSDSSGVTRKFDEVWNWDRGGCPTIVGGRGAKPSLKAGDSVERKTRAAMVEISILVSRRAPAQSDQAWMKSSAAWA